MAAPTKVNTQITDAIAEINTIVLGNAPAIAANSLYQSSSQAVGNACHNATVAQQHGNMIAQAVATQAVNLIYSIKI